MNPNPPIVPSSSMAAGMAPKGSVCRTPLQETTYLELAACLLGMPSGGFWDYREGTRGISFRTPDGYRHRFTFAELELTPAVGAECHESQQPGREWGYGP